MSWARATIAGLALVAGLTPLTAQARHHQRMSCCQVPAGTPIEIELAEPVDAKVQKTGDTFAIRLAAPLIVDHRVVLRAGAAGVGEVVQAQAPGIGGKPAKLVLAARYLQSRHGHLAIDRLQLGGVGRDNSMAAQALGIGGIGFAPLGVVGIVLPGGNIALPAGTRARAQLVEDTYLPSLGAAPRGAVSLSAGDEQMAGPIQIPPPPAGKGEVVFFRPKSLLGTGQWFKVRENGAALGTLNNGAYFVQIVDPGRHTYTAKLEPEFKDKLILQVDPGGTYYVEGSLTKAIVVGAADLTPSDQLSFEKAAGHLTLAVAEPAKGPETATPEPQPAASVSTPAAATSPASAPEASSEPASAAPAVAAAPDVSSASPAAAPATSTAP